VQEGATVAVNVVELAAGDLPVLWDADFLYGPPNEDGRTRTLTLASGVGVRGYFNRVDDCGGGC